MTKKSSLDRRRDLIIYIKVHPLININKKTPNDKDNLLWLPAMTKNSIAETSNFLKYPYGIP